MKNFSLFLFSLFFFIGTIQGQATRKQFTRQDTLMGSNTPQRAWWDVQHYDVEVTPDYLTKSIRGRTTIHYIVTTDTPHKYIQVDLQKPMVLDSIYYNEKSYRNDPLQPYYNDGSHWFIPLPKETKGSTHSLTIIYHGKPKEAVNAPWDGGWVWSKDQKGRPWMSAAVEGDGASTWFPCKDLWSDEPDEGSSLTMIVPQDLTAVANGRLKSKKTRDGKNIFAWEVTSPINSYNIIPYIGHYTSWSDTLTGEKGSLDLTYWVLDYEEQKARKQFEQVKPTLRAFEYWFGPYPFYKDGYQLVQSPYLGMEHQSAVAYGNKFENGYLKTDLSGTGWGLKWDYIIVHETGHEWFGNNITARDRADMWIHEAFTDYSEPLFIESYFGKEAANEYTQGLRKNIANDRPIIAAYGVNKEGSGDMYFKGANMLHTIRQIINDEVVFRQILRGLNKEFYHLAVTSQQVEDYIISKSGKNLKKVFDQYLRSTKIPVLEYKQTGQTFMYRWNNVVTGFDMPVRLINGTMLYPTSSWRTIRLKDWENFNADKNFYINLKKL